MNRKKENTSLILLLSCFFVFGVTNLNASKQDDCMENSKKLVKVSAKMIKKLRMLESETNELKSENNELRKMVEEIMKRLKIKNQNGLKTKSNNSLSFSRIYNSEIQATRQLRYMKIKYPSAYIKPIGFGFKFEK